MPKSAISTVLILLIKSWLMPDYLLLHTSQDNLYGAYSHMEKRGSRYLRYALYNAAKYVCHWDPTFAEYLAKKRAEGKHYNVAISHAVKKLVRVIYHLEKTNQQYIKACLSFSNSILLFLSTSNDALFVMQFSRFKEL